MVSTVQAAALVAAGKTAAGVISLKVAVLTESMVRTMLMTKLKVTAAFLVVFGTLALGGGVVAHRSWAGAPVDPPAAAALAATPIVADEEAAEQDRAQRPQAKGGATVAGTLQAVDADKLSVTVSTFNHRDGAGEKTLPVAKDAKILRDGKAAQLADLKKGNKATLTLSADQKTVVSISAGTPPLSAPLKSVDASKNTISVTVGTRAAKEDKTYQVAKDAKITIDGKEAKLADLKEGTLLSLAVIDGNTVIEVRTASRRDRKQDE